MERNFVKSRQKLTEEGEEVNFEKELVDVKCEQVSHCDHVVKFTALKIKTRLFDNFLYIYIKRQLDYSFLFCSFYGPER